jgi:hypothetical protein
MDPEELLQSKVNQSVADGRLPNGRGLELVGCLIIDAVGLPRSDEEMAEVRSELAAIGVDEELVRDAQTAMRRRRSRQPVER